MNFYAYEMMEENLDKMNTPVYFYLAITHKIDWDLDVIRIWYNSMAAVCEFNKKEKESFSILRLLC